jgi:hypothetical protein
MKGGYRQGVNASRARAHGVMGWGWDRRAPRTRRGGAPALVFLLAAATALLHAHAFGELVPRGQGDATLPAVDMKLAGGTAAERGFEIHFVSFADCGSASRRWPIERSVRSCQQRGTSAQRMPANTAFTRWFCLALAGRRVFSQSKHLYRSVARCAQANVSGYFDAVHVHTLETLDKDFLERNSDFVPSGGTRVKADGKPTVRGCGYWLWKPQVRGRISPHHGLYYYMHSTLTWAGAGTADQRHAVRRLQWGRPSSSP